MTQGCYDTWPVAIGIESLVLITIEYTLDCAHGVYVELALIIPLSHSSIWKLELCGKLTLKKNWNASVRHMKISLRHIKSWMCLGIVFLMFQKPFMLESFLPFQLQSFGYKSVFSCANISSDFNNVIRMVWVKTMERRAAFKICAIAAKRWNIKLYYWKSRSEKEIFCCVYKTRQRWGRDMYTFVCELL